METINTIGINSIIGGALIVLVLVLIFVILLKGYTKAPPDKAVVISGHKKEPRFIIGRAALVIPGLERKNDLCLSAINVLVRTSEPVQTADFIAVTVDATVNVQIPSPSSDDDEETYKRHMQMLKFATRNFLDKDSDWISEFIHPVLEGNIREIIGKMNLKDMVGDRQMFSEHVAENAAPQLAELGLEIKTFNVQNFKDEQGIIAALGVDNEAKIKKDAAISKAVNSRIIREETAKAESEANAAEVASQQQIAERENELRIKRAELKKQSDQEQANADNSYNISEQEQRLILEQKSVGADIARRECEVKLAQEEVEVAKQKLEAEISKKADAEKYAAQQKAEADLYTRTKEAEAKQIEAERQRDAQKAAAEAELFTKQKEAEAIKAKGEADASAIAATGAAEAKAIAAKGAADAESILKKAEAMKQYGEAAKLEMYLNSMPAIAAAIAQPMSAIDKVSIIGSDASGINELPANVSSLMARTFQSVDEATGLNMSDLVRAKGYDAKVTKNININGAPGMLDGVELHVDGASPSVQEPAPQPQVVVVEDDDDKDITDETVGEAVSDIIENPRKVVGDVIGNKIDDIVQNNKKK